MFYVETIDGEKFCSNAQNIKDEINDFSRIIEQKMGKDCSTMFKGYISEVADSAEVYWSDGDGYALTVEPYESAIQEAINALDELIPKSKNQTITNALKDIRRNLVNHE